VNEPVRELLSQLDDAQMKADQGDIGAKATVLAWTEFWQRLDKFNTSPGDRYAVMLMIVLLTNHIYLAAYNANESTVTFFALLQLEIYAALQCKKNPFHYYADRISFRANTMLRFCGHGRILAKKTTRVDNGTEPAVCIEHKQAIKVMEASVVARAWGDGDDVRLEELASKSLSHGKDFRSRPRGDMKSLLGLKAAHQVKLDRNGNRIADPAFSLGVCSGLAKGVARAVAGTDNSDLLARTWAEPSQVTSTGPLGGVDESIFNAPEDGIQNKSLCLAVSDRSYATLLPDATALLDLVFKFAIGLPSAEESKITEGSVQTGLASDMRECFRDERNDSGQAIKTGKNNSSGPCIVDEVFRLEGDGSFRHKGLLFDVLGVDDAADRMTDLIQQAEGTGGDAGGGSSDAARVKDAAAAIGLPKSSAISIAAAMAQMSVNDSERRRPFPAVSSTAARKRQRADDADDSDDADDAGDAPPASSNP
jgi:hypothetical protein